MSLPNVRVAIVGAVRADAEVDALEVNAREAQRLAATLERDAAAFKRELDGLLSGRIDASGDEG